MALFIVIIYATFCMITKIVVRVWYDCFFALVRIGELCSGPDRAFVEPARSNLALRPLCHTPKINKGRTPVIKHPLLVHIKLWYSGLTLFELLSPPLLLRTDEEIQEVSLSVRQTHPRRQTGRHGLYIGHDLCFKQRLRALSR